MKRCCQISLLSAALAAALPLYASDVAADAEQRSPTNLAAVRVQGQVEEQSPQTNSFGAGEWKETPASINVVDRQLLDNRHVRSLTELVATDSALGDAYAPVGYYQNLSIRGFALDTATGYRFNGMSIAGEQRQALEHVQQVEILKGEAGLSAGVIAPGGLINYVGKRPADVRTLSLGTDSEGSRYAAIDYGHWINPRIGIRFNAAWEDSNSYIEHADGRRNSYAFATDWLIGERGKLEIDANYHTSSQRSASGYQLLGASQLPRDIDPSQMLGYQAWQRPVGIDSSVITALHTYDFSSAWQSRLSASHSRSVIDDNVAFAYGCYYVEACWDGSVPGNYFAPNGDYDIYDYRSPDDTRRNQQLRAELRGKFATDAVSHELSVGADYFRRTVDKRSNVNEYVGSANIHDSSVPQYAPVPLEPGAKVRRLDSEQTSLFVMDRMRFGDTWQWLVGGRFVRLDENAWNRRGEPERRSKLSQFLPHTALIWNVNASANVYASYAEGISLGQEAPFWTTNEGVFMDSIVSRQLELGVKYAPSSAFSLSAALFRIRQPFQYAQPDDSDYGYSFVQKGQQVHTGIELSANGQLSDKLRINASVNLLQARAHDTGTPSYEGHALINVPKTRANFFADYQLPISGLALTGGWRYASSNVATADGSVSAPSYSVIDAGVRYQHQLAGHAWRWNLFIDNVFDKFYWRDTGSSQGDYYLFPGSPRQVRISVSVDL